MERPQNKGVHDFSLDEVSAGIQGAARRWKTQTGALFLGIGRRKRRGNIVDEWCVKFYVRRKSRRPAKGRTIPQYITIRITSEGKRHALRLPTDVVSIPPLRPMAVHAAKVAYIYNENSPNQQGSVAAVVEIADSGQRYLLTAGHVAARLSEVATANPGERILDEEGNLVGNLAYAPDLTRIPTDAALIRPAGDSAAGLPRRIDGRPVTEVCPLGGLHKGGPGGYKMLSWIDERFTFWIGWAYDIAVKYKAGTITFPRLLEFDCSATGGDSGSLVVDEQNRAIGMHILGIEGRTSFCLPIEVILETCTPGGPLRLVG
jgi:hypothetical protein